MTARSQLALTIATRHYRRYRLGPGVERPVTRVVTLLLLSIVVLTLAFAGGLTSPGPSEQAQQLARLTPRQLLGEPSHFLPTPVAALPPEPNTGPPAPAIVESNSTQATFAERVKVANTGGVGVLLRSDPPAGRLVASLRDGQVLEVLGHQMVSDAEWLCVRTSDGVEGWVFAKLVGPAP